MHPTPHCSGDEEMYRVIVSNYEERQKVHVLEYLVLLGCDSQWYTVKMLGLLQPYFGHLSCMPVVYVTRYTLQTSKDASNLIQSVVENLLHFVRLGSSCRRPINQHFC